MLQKTTHIEGLEGHYEDLQLENDTPPQGVQVRFDVVPVEQTFLTAQENRPVYKDEVYITKEWELGRSRLARKIRDIVEFKDGRYIVKKLARNSDIKEYPDAWNAFARGQSQENIGTPLSLLFKADPSKVEVYKFRHIQTVEQLAGLNSSNAQDLGMDAASDIERAKGFLRRTKEQGASLELNLKLEQMERENSTLKSQLEDLNDKLGQLLSAQIEEAKAKPTRTRTKKVEGE